MASINGKRVVFTGELESMTRTEAQAKAKALGAIVGSAVNAETDLLVAGPGAGSKFAAALKHGVKVLNEKQWLKIAGGGSKAAPAKVAKTSAKKAAKKAAVSAGKKAAGKKTAKSAATKSPKKKATQSASKKAAAKTTSNTTAKSTAAAPAADPSRLWTLLSEPDLASINQGLELGAALPGEIDGLLKGCSVLKNGTIKRSKRFGSDDGESQEFLNLALLGLLSLAPDRSAAAKLRKSVTKIDMQVADVPRLAGFTALESLDLSSYANEPSEAPRATDLSRFGAMPKLKLIQLSLSWLTSLEGLDAPNLTQAICSSCEALTDVSSLSGLPVLTNLDLRGCRELTDLGPLSGLKSLKSLRLTSCEKLTDLKPLSDLKALKSLDMRNCSTLTDLKPLSGLKSLKSLDLGGRSSLPNMSPLSGLKALTSLSLFDCGSLTDLAPLARLKALTSLDLSFCRSLTDLGPLSGLKALTSLSLAWCKKLNDLGPLAGLEALTSLSLESCEKLTDLAPLARLKALTSLRLSDCEGLPKRLRAYDTYSGESVQALLKALRGTSMIELPRREAGRVAAGIRRGGGRLLIGGVVTEISHALGTVVDSRGRERDAFMVEEGTSEVYAVFSMPEQAAESVEAIVAIGRGANLLGYKWEGLESTEGKGGFGPFCARTKRRISGKFHDGGDIKVIKLTRDGDPDVEFESPDGTREPIETDEALSLLKALAAESGGKAPRKAAKRKAQRKSSKKAAKATKKTSKQSSKKTANTTKKTSKKRSPRR